MPGRIEDYALIGDLQTAALVGRDGSIDWLCLPRFDSPSCFAALLGGDEHGHWRLAPASDGEAPFRSYIGDSLVLQTEWTTSTGSVRVIDFMPQRDHTPDVMRIVEGISGSVKMVGELRLRFDYARIIPWMRRTDHHRIAIAGPDAVWLRYGKGVRTFGRDFATYSEFTVQAGERVPFVLSWTPSYHRAAPRQDPEKSLQTTLEDWHAWASRCASGLAPQDMAAARRSLIVLKALTYEPTGGIVAAATAGLPEQIGGARNWDYRFCWLRDSTMTLSALLNAGYRDEAEAWYQWLLRAIAGDPADMQTMYGVAGERRLPEQVADWLPGYEGSHPVRFGNAAVDQLQLDVYGEVVDTLYLAHRHGIRLEAHVWSLLVKLLEFLEEHWSDPDEGLWEVRGPRRHFVHSKIMCWVAFDRAVKLADETGMAAPVERWRELRDIVHTDICTRGVDKKRGVLTQYYGGGALDASTLFAIKSGFFAPDDPRAIATVDAVQHELNHEGYILRYSTPSDDAATDEVDGLAGSEGAFLACSYWLCDALIALGRIDEARARFDRLRGLANDVGLISEEWDPLAGRQLGNTPQAFTHVALANTAFLLARAEGTGVTGMTADATADAAADAAAGVRTSAGTRTGTRKEG